MYNIVDLTHLRWGNTKGGSDSYGCYLKASEVVNGKKLYYKLSSYNSNVGFFGDESVYEVITSRFLRKLGFNVVDYKLIKARVKVYGKIYETYASVSEDYSKGYDSRCSFEHLREMNMGLSQEEFITKFNFSKSIKDIIIVDFLIIGRDRHGANIEVLLKNNKYTIAPIFDNGLSLLCSIPQTSPNALKEVENFDVLYDYRVNNYIGKQSLYSNLCYITSTVRVKRLTLNDKRSIFYNMSGVLPKYYRDKIWKIFTYRYSFLRMRGLIKKV